MGPFPICQLLEDWLKKDEDNRDVQVMYKVVTVTLMVPPESKWSKTYLQILSAQKSRGSLPVASWLDLCEKISSFLPVRFLRPSIFAQSNSKPLIFISFFHQINAAVIVHHVPHSRHPPITRLLLHRHGPAHHRANLTYRHMRHHGQ